MNEPPARDLYARVTAHIVAAVERGAGDYRMPWHGSSADATLPLNVASGRHYRGVNVLCLWADARQRGYGSAVWGTYRQWQELGAQVRKGERAAPVVLWKEVVRGVARTATDASEDVDDDGQKKRLVAKGYWVFNAAQVEGYSPPATPRLSEGERVTAAEDFLFGLGADIRHAGGQAYYRTGEDYIQMPPFAAFHSAAGYYGTLAHELTHWTGAGDRLARDLKNRFGTEAYAAEELVAELGAAFQLARLGLSSQPRPDHAAYVASWLKLLRNDTRAIFTAAGKAQQAVDWLEMRHEQLRSLKGEQHPLGRGLEGSNTSRPAMIPGARPRPGDEEFPMTDHDAAQRRANYDALTRLLDGRQHRRIENDPFLPLVVERLEGQPLVSLCHYGEQNGDPMRDPEVVFLVSRTTPGTGPSVSGSEARPVYFRNDYAGVEHATVEGHFGDVPVKPQLQEGLNSLVATWFETLHEQGFFEKADLTREQAAENVGAVRGQEQQRPLAEGPEKVDTPRAGTAAGDHEKEMTMSETNEVVTEQQEGGRKPEVKLSCGSVRGSVWLNQSAKNGSEYLSVSIARVYKGQDGTTKTTQSFRLQDLPDLVEVAQGAQKFIQEESLKRGLEQQTQGQRLKVSR
jgi:antirestriction protein ArdC